MRSIYEDTPEDDESGHHRCGWCGVVECTSEQCATLDMVGACFDDVNESVRLCKMECDVTLMHFVPACMSSPRTSALKAYKLASALKHIASDLDRSAGLLMATTSPKGDT